MKIPVRFQVNDIRENFYRRYSAYFGKMPDDGKRDILTWAERQNPEALAKMFQMFDEKTPDRRPLLGQLKKAYWKANQLYKREIAPQADCALCSGTGMAYICIAGNDLSELQPTRTVAAYTHVYENCIPCKCTKGKWINGEMDEPYQPSTLTRLQSYLVPNLKVATDFIIECKAAKRQKEMLEELSSP
jgi:hypothetical protein